MICAAFPGIVSDDAKLQVLDEAHLPAALVWYSVITYIRNDIMHVNTESGGALKHYPINCRTFFTDASCITPHYTNQNETPEALKEDFERALSAVEGKVILRCKDRIWSDVEEWKLGKNSQTSTTETTNGVFIRPCGSTSSEVIQNIKHALTNGHGFLVLDGNEAWKPYKKSINDDSDVQLSPGIRIISRNESNAPLIGGVSPEESQIIAVEAEKARKVTLGTKSVDEVIIWDGLRRLEPFRNSAFIKLFANIAPKKGSFLQKFCNIYHDNFQMVQCVTFRR